MQKALSGKGVEDSKMSKHDYYVSCLVYQAIPCVGTTYKTLRCKNTDNNANNSHPQKYT